jgi:hypothetical protein
MDEYESLNHTKWECKYHVVLVVSQFDCNKSSDKPIAEPGCPALLPLIDQGNYILH